MSSMLEKVAAPAWLKNVAKSPYQRELMKVRALGGATLGIATGMGVQGAANTISYFKNRKPEAFEQFKKENPEEYKRALQSTGDYKSRYNYLTQDKDKNILKRWGKNITGRNSYNVMRRATQLDHVMREKTKQKKK